MFIPEVLHGQEGCAHQRVLQRRPAAQADSGDPVPGHHPPAVPFLRRGQHQRTPGRGPVRGDHPPDLPDPEAVPAGGRQGHHHRQHAYERTVPARGGAPARPVAAGGELQRGDDHGQHLPVPPPGPEPPGLRAVLSGHHPRAAPGGGPDPRRTPARAGFRQAGDRHRRPGHRRQDHHRHGVRPGSGAAAQGGPVPGGLPERAHHPGQRHVPVRPHQHPGEPAVRAPGPDGRRHRHHRDQRHGLRLQPQGPGSAERPGGPGGVSGRGPDPGDPVRPGAGGSAGGGLHPGEDPCPGHLHQGGAGDRRPEGPGRPGGHQHVRREGAQPAPPALAAAGQGAPGPGTPSTTS